MNIRTQHVGALSFSKAHPPGEHVRDKVVVVAIQINIGTVNRHRRHAVIANNLMIGKFKGAVPLVNPEFIHGIKVIIANVDIGELVIVEITHGNTEPPIERSLGQWPAVGIKKGPFCPDNRLKLSTAKIFI